MKSLDVYILALFQITSWKFERFFGKTNFFLSGTIAAISVFTALVIEYNMQFSVRGVLEVLMLLPAVTLQMLIVILAMSCARASTEANRKGKRWLNPLQDPRDPSGRQGRVLLILASCPVIAFVLYFGFTTAAVLCVTQIVSLYFLACTPLQECLVTR
jgi:hypothetical protein